MENQQVKREVAVKIWINSILEGKYTKEEGWKPNYITINNGENISRVNIIGVVVSEPDVEEKNQSLNIDDGSGKIMLRSFEDGIILNNFNLGDVVNVIGKPKEYMGLKYIIPEIVKKISDKKWIEVRKKELEIKDKNNPSSMAEPVNIENKKIEEDVIEEETDVDKILNIIKDLDKGDGVFIEDVLDKIRKPDSEKMINSLMEQGEIFEIQPGKVKVLE